METLTIKMGEAVIENDDEQVKQVSFDRSIRSTRVQC
jgi:hypothetical protein